MEKQVFESQLPPADAIIAIPQAEQSKVHGDKLLQNEPQVFQSSSDQLMGTYEKKTTETSEKFTFYKDSRTDSEKREFGSMLDKTMDANKPRFQQTKLVRVGSGKRRDSWAHLESIGFGREPNRIFDIYHLPMTKEEEVDPITNSIHCAALQAREQFKVARASNSIFDMWQECKNFPEAFHQDMWKKSSRTERLMHQQQQLPQQQFMASPSSAFQQQQQQQSFIQQGALSGAKSSTAVMPIMQSGSALSMQSSSGGSSFDSSSNNASTRRIEISRVEERINIEEKKPIIAELQPGTLLQQRNMLGVQ